MDKNVSNLDKMFIRKALKETPSLKVGFSIPKSMKKGVSDLPMFGKVLLPLDGFNNDPDQLDLFK